jgi:phage-related tail fiber protein
MARNYLTPINLNSNELQSAKVHLLASDPGSPADGLVWINTTSWVLKIRLNGATISLGRLDQITAPTAAVAFNGQKIIGLADPTVTTDGATKQYVDGRRLDQAVAPTGPVSLNSQKITALLDPTVATDGVNKQYVDGRRLDQIAAPIAPVSLNSQKIAALLDPTSAQEAATKNYVDGRRLDQLANPTAPVNLNSQRISGLADATGPTDAVTKQQLDAAQAGLDAKQSVRAATTANIALSGLQTVDGISLSATDRVLVKNQTAPAENGIYVAAVGAWSRALDMDAFAEVPAAHTFVEQGTANDNTGWVCLADAGGTLGTTAIAWSKFSASAPGPQKFAVSIGNGALTSIPVVHNLGSIDVFAQARDSATGAVVEPDIVVTDANTVTFGFQLAPATNAIRVTVIG